MKIVFAAIVLLALVGCAQGWVYRKPGATEAMYNREIYECRKDAAPVQDVILKREMINDCMRVKGWSATLE